jgi:uncharacterized integral membrane protein
VKDDDLDLDLDLELEPAGAATRPGPAAAEKPETAGKAQAEPAKVMSGRKPGALAKVGSSVTGHLAHFGRLNWSFRNFVILLVALLILVVLGQNWEPVRIYLLGLKLELPKAVAFVVDLALGGLLAWLWMRRQPASRGE